MPNPALDEYYEILLSEEIQSDHMLYEQYKHT